MINSQIEHRRAIEALRAGVPNRDAVRALGCSQPAIEAKFREQLQAAREKVWDGVQSPGMLITGDFGAGKSHLLEYLQHIAMEENFVCSKVVISKETPLFDPIKLFRSAIQAALLPDKRGAVLTEVAMKLHPENKAYNKLYSWVHSSESKLNARFAATLFLSERIKPAEEFWHRIISFWSGDPIGTGEIRKLLKEWRATSTYKIEKVKIKDLAIQRFKFAPRLMVAAGYSGWVLLIDEIELIGRYSPFKRADSYLELARWMGKLPGQHFPGLTTVLTLMSNFELEVLDEKNDLKILLSKLKDKGRDDLAKNAERGMRIIQGECLRLNPPDNNLIQQAHEKVREIYEDAYSWQAPLTPYEPQPGSTVMRQHVKRWITECDLRRLFPDYTPIIEMTGIKIGYIEDTNLEVQSEGDFE